MKTIVIAILFLVFGFTIRGIYDPFKTAPIMTSERPAVTPAPTPTVQQPVFQSTVPPVVGQLTEKPAGIDTGPREDFTYQVVFREHKPAELVKTTAISKLTNQPEMKRVDAVYTVQFKGVQTGTTYPRVQVSEQAYNALRPMMVVDRPTLNGMMLR